MRTFTGNYFISFICFLHNKLRKTDNNEHLAEILGAKGRHIGNELT